MTTWWPHWFRSIRSHPRMAVALVVVVTALTYQGVVRNGFVLDDFHTVETNRSLDSFTRAGEWLWSGEGVSGRAEIRGYRPVLMASYALDRAIWGESPAGHHLGNLVVHVVVVILTYVLGARLWGHPWAGVAAAVWVALHPLNAEAVNYVTARSSSLMAAWVLAAVVCYDVSIPRGGSARTRLLWRGAAVLFGAAALGAKEAGVVLPLLIMVWDRMRSDDRSWRRTAIRALPFWIMTGALLAIRSAVLGAAVGIGGSERFVQDALFAGKIALVSWGHWFYPVGLAIDYAWPRSIGGWESVAIPAGVVVAFGVTVAAFRRHPRIGWCLAWFWFSLLPLLVLPLVSRMTLYQEHRSYLGGIALAWLAGWAAVEGWRVASRYRAAPVAVVLTGVLLVWAVWIDVDRTRVWSHEEQVWEDTLAKYPRSTLGLNARGKRLADAGRLDEARVAFEASLAIDSSLAVTHNFLGAVYASLGRYERALAEFQLATLIAPSNTNVRMNIAKIYERQNDPQKALAVYEQLVRDYPRHAPGLARSAMLLERDGRLAEAAERYARVLSLDPGDDQVRAARGTILLRLERWRDAEEEWSRLVILHPDSSEVWFNLGVSREGLKLDKAAVEAFQRAADIATTDPDPYFRIGVMAARRGEWAEAVTAFHRALARDPGHILSRMNLALAAEQQQDVALAAAAYRALIASVPEDSEFRELRTRAQEGLNRLASGRSGKT